jgi:large subunit ribosomal protein L10
MVLADLESREVLLAKLAGAMKGTIAKAARTFDALRLKQVSEQGADASAVEVPAQAAPETTEVLESAAVDAPAAEETPVVETPVVETPVVETPVAEATEEKE